MNNMLKVLKK